MRNPTTDANAGAITQVAPTVTHAQRTATIAKDHNNQAIAEAANYNKAASSLGNALGKFMKNKQATEMEQRYTEAFHNQGVTEGLKEFDRDAKKTGFAELMYGGQTPEYLGRLDAAARNSATSMYVEEATHIEGKGADLTPDEYRQYIATKITAYNEEFFADAPDAAMAFMKNWKDNSNALAKQHTKLYKVRELQKAKQTVSEGWQADFSKYKVLMQHDPDAAIQLGQDMYSGKYMPKDMSPAVAREVLIEESLAAAKRHDFAAFQLLKDSGMVEGFSTKELTQYEKARTVLDGDNFNMLEAARLQYQTAIEAENATSDSIATAKAQYDNAIQQVSARDTGSVKHLKTAFGADRWRGELGNRYQTRLKKEAKERVDRSREVVEYVEEGFDVELARAEPAAKRDLIADRLDDISVALLDTTLAEEVSSDLRNQFLKYKKQLDNYDSALDARTKKEQAQLDKARLAELELKVGADSLRTGGRYVTVETKDKKAHLSKAVSDVANTIDTDPDKPVLEKIEGIFSNPVTLDRYLKGAGEFKGYLKDSREIKTTIANLAANIGSELTEDGSFTEDQKQRADSLRLIADKAGELYVSVTTADQRVAIKHMQDAMLAGGTVSEATRKLDTIKAASDVKPSTTIKAEDVQAAAGTANAPKDIQDLVYTEYKKFLPLGSDVAKAEAAKYARNLNVRAGNFTVRYGNTFEPVLGNNLEDTIKILSKSYRTGDQFKTGFTRVLAQLNAGSSDSAGGEIATLEQIPNAKLSIFNGGITIELPGRVQMIHRAEMEAEINGYNQWFRETQRRKLAERRRR